MTPAGRRPRLSRVSSIGGRGDADPTEPAGVVPLNFECRTAEIERPLLGDWHRAKADLGSLAVGDLRDRYMVSKRDAKRRDSELSRSGRYVSNDEDI